VFEELKGKERAEVTGTKLIRQKARNLKVRLTGAAGGVSAVLAAGGVTLPSRPLVLVVALPVAVLVPLLLLLPPPPPPLLTLSVVLSYCPLSYCPSLPPTPSPPPFNPSSLPSYSDRCRTAASRLPLSS
jgi:hypothetical protein